MTTDLPTYGDLMLAVVLAMQALGGSGTGREISASVVETEGFSEELLEVTYDGRIRALCALLVAIKRHGAQTGRRIGR